MRPMQGTFLSLALCRAARGTGSHQSFLQQRTTIIPVPDLTTLLPAVRWVLVNDLAIRAYMPERMTLDVDILIAATDAETVHSAFMRAGYRMVGTLSISGFTVQNANEPPIDVLTTDEPWLIEALHQPNYDGLGNPVLPRPALIMMKLHAGRTQDLADVQRILATTPQAERESIRQQLASQNADLVEEFAALIQLADWEFGEQLPLACE